MPKTSIINWPPRLPPDSSSDQTRHDVAYEDHILTLEAFTKDKPILAMDVDSVVDPVDWSDESNHSARLARTASPVSVVVSKKDSNVLPVENCAQSLGNETEAHSKMNTGGVKIGRLRQVNVATMTDDMEIYEAARSESRCSPSKRSRDAASSPATSLLKLEVIDASADCTNVSRSVTSEHSSGLEIRLHLLQKHYDKLKAEYREMTLNYTSAAESIGSLKAEVYITKVSTTQNACEIASLRSTQNRLAAEMSKLRRTVDHCRLEIDTVHSSRIEHSRKESDGLANVATVRSLSPSSSKLSQANPKPRRMTIDEYRNHRQTSRSKVREENSH